MTQIGAVRLALSGTVLPFRGQGFHRDDRVWARFISNVPTPVRFNLQTQPFISSIKQFFKARLSRVPAANDELLQRVTGKRSLNSWGNAGERRNGEP